MNPYGMSLLTTRRIQLLCISDTSREKIEINPKDPRYIKVVWGTGYKLEGDN